MSRQIVDKRIEIGRTLRLYFENCVGADIHWYEMFRCLGVENSLLYVVLAFYKHLV